MATCKDCLSFKVCRKKKMNIIQTSEYFEITLENNVEKTCKHFKDKAKYAEVKYGEWKVNVGMNFNKERICSVCKKEIKSNCWGFCSNCGANMGNKG